jgi:Holliday junction resolvase RusA-like endonuclease
MNDDASMKPICFFVPGNPKGQPRARRGRGTHMYTPDTAKGFKECIYFAAREHAPKVPFTGPVSMTLTAVFARPKTHFYTGKREGVLRPGVPTYHTSKPDRDNIEKAVLDALTRLRFWRDDSLVCDGPVTKRYEGDGFEVGCYVEVRLLAPTASERSEA